MARIITDQYLEDLGLDALISGDDADAHRRRSERVATLVAMVDDPDLIFDTDVTRAYLLTLAAADCLEMGDPQRAVELARKAMATDEYDSYDAVTALIVGLDALGLDDEVNEEISRAAMKSIDDELSDILQEAIGEAFEQCGRLGAAEVWYDLWTVNSFRVPEGDRDLDTPLEHRFMVRRRMGQPKDDLDLVAESRAVARGAAIPGVEWIS